MENNNIKILWINANPNPNPGGTEQHSIDFINALENINNLTIYKAVAKGSFVDKNTSDKNKFYITLKSEFSPINTIKLIRLAKKLKPDFVIGNNGNEYINTFLAGKLSGSKVILFRHMLNYQPFFIKKFILPNVDKIFAVSYASKLRLMKDGISENKITVLYNFIDEEKFYYSEFEKQQVRQQLKISPNEKVITFIGKVAEGKGIFDFVEVSKLLAKKYDNLKFLIIGDGKELSIVKEMIKEYGLSDKYIITGYTNKPEYFLKASDFVLVLSKGEESFGRTVVEGFAVKSLVVVYDVENLKYLVEDFKTGLVAEKGNYKQVFDKLDKVLSDENLYKTIVENGYNEFKNKFTKKIILEKFLKELQDFSG
jgi:glycosyltransferase involved in cell wall biosynthesis